MHPGDDLQPPDFVAGLLAVVGLLVLGLATGFLLLEVRPACT